MNAAIVTLDAKYDPVNTDISKENIIIVQAAITKAQKDVMDSINPEKEALIARNAAYVLMSTMATDSLRVFKSSKGVTPAQVKLATNFAKKVHSVRIKPIKKTPVVITTDSVDAKVLTAEEAEIVQLRHNSISEQQFEGRSGNLLAYLTYLSGQLNYATNNERLKITTMMDYQESLPLLNSTAEATIFGTNKVRGIRNETFFNNTSGARFLYTQVKDYFASFGTKSVENKMVKGLPFPNLIKLANRTPTTNY